MIGGVAKRPITNRIWLADLALACERMAFVGCPRPRLRQAVCTETPDHFRESMVTFLSL
jgi:hypothetical protein